VHASLLLPYFDFDGQGDQGTGVHAEARNFQLNTDAALQYLATNGASCFDQVYLVGSDIKARYDFSIGGRSQDNDAHIIELLATLGVRHGCSAMARGEDQVTWEDVPDNVVVGTTLARAARFAVAWKRNFSLEVDSAQSTPVRVFTSGAPWIRRYFSQTEESTKRSEGRPSIRAQDELALKQAIDSYVATLLQWLRQFSGNAGLGFKQELFSEELLSNEETYANQLHNVVRGSARPTLEEHADSVDRIKILMDRLSERDIKFRGIAGLADSLWKLCIQPMNS
jgi:hypothetical protein